MDEKRCFNCIWRNGEPNEHNIVRCAYFGSDVYAFSLPCKQHEYYDHRKAAEISDDELTRRAFALKLKHPEMDVNKAKAEIKRLLAKDEIF